jgi:hypothetical protein
MAGVISPYSSPRFPAFGGAFPLRLLPGSDADEVMSNLTLGNLVGLRQNAPALLLSTNIRIKTHYEVLCRLQCNCRTICQYVRFVSRYAIA